MNITIFVLNLMNVNQNLEVVMANKESEIHIDYQE